MAKTLDEILGYVYLTGLVEDVMTGIPKVLPDAFWSNKSKTLKDQGRYTRYSGTRKVARRIEYGSPTLNTSLSSLGSFDVKLITLGEHIQLNMTDYMSLRGYTNYGPQSMGEQEVERQIQQFAARFTNAEIAAVHAMLSKGAIYFDSSGNLLPSSSSAAVTVDYNIPSGNKAQLNVDGGGNKITASWAVATTNIPGNVRSIMNYAVQKTGYPLKFAFYGSNIPEYLSNNNYLANFLYREPTMRSEYLNKNIIPDGLLGLTWIPSFLCFFEDQNGTNQSWFDADAITFAPEINSMNYELMQGTYPVPTSFQPQTPEGTPGAFEEKLGTYAYGVPVHNPPTAQIHSGSIFLPIWKIPDTLFLADTTP